MNDWSWTQARITDAVGNLEAAGLDAIAEVKTAMKGIQAAFQAVAPALHAVLHVTQERLPKGDGRQAFIDRAAIWAPHDDPAQAYQFAEDLWEERERRRGQPSERELVVQWLTFQARTLPAEKRSTYEAIADAIKAGKHATTLKDIREKIRGFQSAELPEQCPTCKSGKGEEHPADPMRACVDPWHHANLVERFSG